MKTSKTSKAWLDQSVAIHAMRLYLRTGDGFIMHMNDGSTICRKCVDNNKDVIFRSLSFRWSKDEKWAACFADLFTKDTAASKCGRCNKPLQLHVPPPTIEAETTEG